MSDAPPEVTITVNGKPAQTQVGASVANFLIARGVEPRLVVVERNGLILPRRDFETTALEADDRLEIVHFVGGG